MTTLLPIVETAAAQLAELWRRSDRIFGLLAPGALLARPIRLRQPFLFYLGHLPNFAWVQGARLPLGRGPLDAEFERIFDRGIDPPANQDFQPDESASWPAPEHVFRYRDRVRQGLREALDDLGRLGSRGEAALRMVVEHESMHQETLLYMVQQLALEQKVAPADLPPLSLGEGAAPDCRRVEAGPARLGRPRDSGFGWDNEFPEWTVEVPAFSVDVLPVRNGEYREFVEAGGYRRRELWDDESWDWKERRGLSHPPFWSGAPGSFQQRSLFQDVPLEQVSGWPVYVTQAEARAYALWKGRRLLTEPEFHRAAYSTPHGDLNAHPWGNQPPSPPRGNFSFDRWAPEPVGSRPAGASAWGIQELVGNGWEWTATPWAPYPGFEPMPTYPGYSADFFDGRHFVLLGGSWATDTSLLRRSFRNWFQPHYPYLFAKFRCASDG